MFGVDLVTIGVSCYTMGLFRLMTGSEYAFLESWLILRILSCIIAPLWIIYGYFQYAFKYWEKKGVVTLKPSIPFGNMKDFVLRKNYSGHNTINIYKQLKKTGKRFGGIYLIGKPILVVLDPDLIKSILTKDFLHFTDRGMYYDEKEDPISAHLYSLGGDKWRNLRTKLTPTFTNENIKMMFPLLIAPCSDLNEYIQTSITNDEPVDAKEVTIRFVISVTVSCAFGLESNSFEEVDKFLSISSAYFRGTASIDLLKRFLTVSFPSVQKFMKFKILSDESNEFLLDTVKNTIRYREENNVQREDFLQLLMRLKTDGNSPGNHSENGNKLTVEEIVAQCFIFYLAGFENALSTITFCLYELSVHPVIQEKLREEILNVLEKSNGNLTYEGVLKMTYMDKVIAETLRKYPSLPILTRQCTKDYIIPDTEVVLEKGTAIYIPSYALHWDPDYYPSPEKFDPERFSDENRNKRCSHTYLPFGEGPRNCIGMRFGLVQTKVGLAFILSRYKISLNPRTQQPLEYDSKSFITKVKNKILLDIKKLAN